MLKRLYEQGYIDLDVIPLPETTIWENNWLLSELWKMKFYVCFVNFSEWFIKLVIPTLYHGEKSIWMLEREKYRW